MPALPTIRACLLSLALTTTFSTVIATSAHAQVGGSTTNSALKTKLDTLDQERQDTLRELELNQSKRQETEQKLKQAERALKTKIADLANVKADVGPNPTAIQTSSIDNEQQRIDLAELEVKYLRATSLRLTNKEHELQAKLKSLDNQKIATEQNVARTQENDRLRAAAAKEAEKNKAEAQRLAEPAKAIESQNSAPARTNEPSTDSVSSSKPNSAPAAAAAAPVVPQPKEEPAPVIQVATPQSAALPVPVPTITATKNTSSELDLSQVALPDEPPVYTGDDGLKAVIRSRSIDRHVVMQPIGPKLYRAKLKVEPGRAFFDVRKRRYRGYFPQTETPQIYDFFYDISGEVPVFSVVLDEGASLAKP